MLGSWRRKPPCFPTESAEEERECDLEREGGREEQYCRHTREIHVSSVDRV